MANPPIPIRGRQRQPPPGAAQWYPLLRRDDRGRVIPDLANVLVALREETELTFAMAFNEMLQHSIVMTEWPHARRAMPGKPPPHETDDDDVSRLQEWLQEKGLPRVGREIVGQAVEVYAHERSFHPVREWLENLVWDGTPRLPTWLFSYLGAEAEDDTAIEYVRMIGGMFLTAMVARIMRPGCQCDYMLVLEGDQGILKSSACRALAGDWFSDSLPENISSKDARQHLRGKWLVEVSELAAFSKTEVEALKAFITRREEKYRPPFGRHDVSEPRQCVFVGTTNQEFYVKDNTGGRRFWPIKCTAIDVEGLRQIKDQLFAEAVAAWRRGDRYWPTPEDEERYFRPQQDRRREDDPWVQVIEKGLEDRIDMTRFTVSTVATTILGFDGASRLNTSDARRITNALRDLGCRQERTKIGRFYVRPVPDDGG